MYAETKHYVNPGVLPKLKAPNRAGAKTKKQILNVYAEIAKRKGEGLAFYKIRGNKQKDVFNSIFDPQSPDIFKGGWIAKAKTNNGKAKLSFSNRGPRFSYGSANAEAIAMVADFIPFDGQAYIKDPAGYIASLKLDPEKDYFPAFGGAGNYALSSVSAMGDSVLDLMLDFESKYNSASKGTVSGFVTYHAN